MWLGLYGGASGAVRSLNVGRARVAGVGSTGIVRQAGLRASADLTRERLPALPDMTPRTLRATYLLLLLADDLDVTRVLRKTEPDDAAIVADVADQLRQRRERAGGAAGDLRNDAREHLYGPTADPDDDHLVNRTPQAT